MPPDPFEVAIEHDNIIAIMLGAAGFATHTKQAGLAIDIPWKADKNIACKLNM